MWILGKLAIGRKIEHNRNAFMKFQVAAQFSPVFYESDDGEKLLLNNFILSPN